ncbi:MAG: DUF3810 domain-containing protein [Eudoraea sp.]|nr:DUF3810 domain-containing protein [Eudoraea sp.]
MKDRLKNGIAIALLPQIALVYWASTNPEFIERYYSSGLYPFISSLYRKLLGWIPISVGDICYMILGALAIYYVIRTRRRLFTKGMLVNVIMVISIAYFTFNIMWGLNYYRIPIADTLGLKETFSKEELVKLTDQLIQKSNWIQEEITMDTVTAIWVPHSQKAIFSTAQDGYDQLAKRYPNLDYNLPSIKPSLLSTMLSYMGYGGYLNPFTLEGQVNAKMPSFRQPVVSAHEMAHQVGYAAENEANFIGYLAASQSPDPFANYSAVTFGLSHCLGQLHAMDSTAYNVAITRLHPGVKKNFIEAREFWESYQNPLEPLFKSAFDTFLKANRQEEGIASYNQVVALLIAYHRKEPLEHL